jgi:hypothetical protein
MGPAPRGVGRNLADRFGLPAADRFLELHQSISGRRDYHPYWDIVAFLGGLDVELDGRRDLAAEDFLAAAVAKL